MSAQALRVIYDSVCPSFTLIPTNQGLSLALLISVPSGYGDADYCVMTVGKESHSWYGHLGNDPISWPTERLPTLRSWPRVPGIRLKILGRPFRFSPR